MAAVTPFTIANPVGTNRICQSLQELFANSLTWLNTAYGEAFRVARGEVNNPKYFPAVFKDMVRRDYLELIPDFPRDGNSVFFYTSSPDSYIVSGDDARIATEVNAVFFARLTDVRPGVTHRPLEEMKKDIISLLISSYRKEYNIDKSVGIDVYERFEDVFANYSYREIEEAVLNMSEYALLRISFSVIGNNCD